MDIPGADTVTKTLQLDVLSRYVGGISGPMGRDFAESESLAKKSAAVISNSLIGIGAATVAVVGYGVKQAVSVQEAATKVQAAHEISKQDFAQYSQFVESKNEGLLQSHEAMWGGINAAIVAGFGPKTTDIIVTSAAKMATALGGDLTSNAQMLTGALKALHTQQKDVLSTTNLIAKAEAVSGKGSAFLSGSAGRLLVQGGAAGMSPQEVLGLIATIEKQNPGAGGGRTLSTIATLIGNLNNPSSTVLKAVGGQKGFDRLGLNLQDHSLHQVLQNIMGLSPDLIRKLLGSGATVGTVKSLLTSTPANINDPGFLNRAYAKDFGTVDAQMKELNIQLKDMTESIGVAFLPVIKAGVPVLKGLMQHFENFSKMVGPANLAKIGIGLGVVGVGMKLFGPFASIITKLFGGGKGIAGSVLGRESAVMNIEAAVVNVYSKGGLPGVPSSSLPSSAAPAAEGAAAGAAPEAAGIGAGLGSATTVAGFAAELAPVAVALIGGAVVGAAVGVLARKIWPDLPKWAQQNEKKQTANEVRRPDGTPISGSHLPDVPRYHPNPNTPGRGMLVYPSGLSISTTKAAAESAITSAMHVRNQLQGKLDKAPLKFHFDIPALQREVAHNQAELAKLVVSGKSVSKEWLKSHPISLQYAEDLEKQRKKAEEAQKALDKHAKAVEENTKSYGKSWSGKLIAAGSGPGKNIRGSGLPGIPDWAAGLKAQQPKVKEAANGVLKAVGKVYDSDYGSLNQKTKGFHASELGAWKSYQDKLVGHSVVPDMLHAVQHAFDKSYDAINHRTKQFVLQQLKDIGGKDIVHAAKAEAAGVDDALKVLKTDVPHIFDAMSKQSLKVLGVFHTQTKTQVKSLSDDVTQQMQDMSDKVVGHSIIPDMTSKIKTTLQAMVTDEKSQLTTMQTQTDQILSDTFAKTEKDADSWVTHIESKINELVKYAKNHPISVNASFSSSGGPSSGVGAGGALNSFIKFGDKFAEQCTALATHWLQKIGKAGDVPIANFAYQWTRSKAFHAGIKGLAPGDVVVWKQNSVEGIGAAGHVDIFYKFARKNGQLGFYTYDANWGPNSNEGAGTAPQMVWHPLADLKAGASGYLNEGGGIGGGVGGRGAGGSHSGAGVSGGTEWHKHGSGALHVQGGMPKDVRGTPAAGYWHDFLSASKMHKVPVDVLLDVAWHESSLFANIGTAAMGGISGPGSSNVGDDPRSSSSIRKQIYYAAKLLAGYHLPWNQALSMYNVGSPSGGYGSDPFGIGSVATGGSGSSHSGNHPGAAVSSGVDARHKGPPNPVRGQVVALHETCQASKHQMWEQWNKQHHRDHKSGETGHGPMGDKNLPTHHHKGHLKSGETGHGPMGDRNMPKHHHGAGRGVSGGSEAHHHHHHHPGQAVSGGVEGRHTQKTAQNSDRAVTKLDQVVQLLGMLVSHAAKSDPELSSVLTHNPLLQHV